VPELWMIAQYLLDCPIYLKLRPSYYDLKIFSTAVLTLNFDLDLSKLKVKFGIDAEHLCPISC